MKPTDMFLYYGLAVLWLIAFLTPLNTAQTCFAEEGTDYDISCSTTPEIASEGLFWNVDAGDGLKKLAGCAGIGFCKTEDMYEDYFDVILESSRSILTIKDVSRSEPFKLEGSKWFCDWKEKNGTDTRCSSLSVYVKPEKPVCDPPLLNTTTYEIQISCNTSRIFPEIKCQIYLSKSGNDSTFTPVSSNVLSTDTPLNETEEYFRSQCTIILSLKYIESHGSYFQVRMYPKSYSSKSSDAFSDSAHINLAIINPSNEEEEDDDEIPYLIIVIVLAAVLGVALIVAIIMGILMCKYRRRKADRASTHELTTGTATTGSYDAIGKRDSGQNNDGYYQDVNQGVSQASTKDSLYQNVQAQTQDDEDLYEN